MSTYREKLSILSEMISFARVDRAIRDAEYDFLLGVSEQLGVHREDFDSLFENKVDKIIPKTQADRILQFHRLVLLMNVDSSNGHPDEIRKLHKIGLRMGLRPSAIEQVLSIMHQYPDKIVPPDVLIGIFKAHYN
ncbi:TerB family tellurite resistance protein [Robiginitalea sp. SC105]|uniref:TerB family tellurite resistance protein n=1 Tax=Robiginitalea sp. SC105 TaxID=2762332 RepID=UPI0016398229|nr:TerB family tellurite resistance protein [Robiginitalea sp. SC105]MBC2839945.1 TerB family tellurite resistance protein [Robiginitalea sp. SC105]